jgi:phosphoribosylaminoimidazole carboxylase PurE protein
MDFLLSIVRMPKGIPVATVAINNAANAALLAIRMLSISDEKLRTKLPVTAEKWPTCREKNSEMKLIWFNNLLQINEQNKQRKGCYE